MKVHSSCNEAIPAAGGGGKWDVEEEFRAVAGALQQQMDHRTVVCAPFMSRSDTVLKPLALLKDSA